MTHSGNYGNPTLGIKGLLFSNLRLAKAFEDNEVFEQIKSKNFLRQNNVGAKEKM